VGTERLNAWYNVCGRKEQPPLYFYPGCSGALYVDPAPKGPDCEDPKPGTKHHHGFSTSSVTTVASVR
jgi:hypothetical protein